MVTKLSAEKKKKINDNLGGTRGIESIEKMEKSL